MRLNKDGTGKTAVGPPSFRELSDIRIHKYGADLPGKQLTCGGGGGGVRACVRTYVYMCVPACLLPAYGCMNILCMCVRECVCVCVCVCVCACVRACVRA